MQANPVFWCLFGLVSLLVAGCGSAALQAGDRPRLGVSLEMTAPVPLGPSPTADLLIKRCDKPSDCPEITIAGRSVDHACLPVSGRPVFAVCPVRGLHDASLTQDPATGDLYLAFSYATLRFDGRPAEDSVISVHDTGLARSQDGGRNWQDLGTVVSARPFDHPAHGRGIATNEVPSLAARSDGSWALLWQRHFNIGEQQYLDAVLNAAEAATPRELVGLAGRSLISGWVNPSVWPARTQLSRIDPALAQCAVFTEPALLAVDDDLYLAAECIQWNVAEDRRVFEGGGIHLFRFPGGRLNSPPLYVGALVDFQDARFFAEGAPRAILTQPALARSRISGRLILLVSVIDEDQAPQQNGCLALDVADITTARLARDKRGRPRVLARIDAPVSGPRDFLGPGQCTYDPNSMTGVIMTLMQKDQSYDPLDLRLSLHATGVHP